ncbi:hypothetical protein [uncultured Flavobacterium sp.]|uniref:hypothetical protein n=1 Tax=uncultured Flavobacterium sp. TaxID=165435 RepID=UPI0030EF6D70|tara:strand:+ start:893 stop:1417 length:525 start_codon:yes stop_codon:yes gene_type:complete
MKNKAALEQSILKLTTTIQQEYPELIQFITEMPQNNSEDEQVTLKSLEDYRNSLKDILVKYSTTHSEESNTDTAKAKAKEYADLQRYPPSEDIYAQFKEEKDLNPEDISKKKTANEKESGWNEKDFGDLKTGVDLDVPGAELDDQQENVGSEDEENNYYSIGGDNHNDLDEDKG